MPSSSRFERVVRTTAAAVAREMGFDPERCEALATAVSEAFSNAVEHGNRASTELPVVIAFRLQPASLLVEVADYGAGFGSRTTPDIDAQVAGRQPRQGWGIHLMEHLVDDVRFERGDHGEHLTCLRLGRADDNESSQGGES